MKVQGSGQKRLFNNYVLERLTRTPIWLPLGIYYTASLALIFYAVAYTPVSWWAAILYTIGGFLLFTFLEYLVHRYFFHMKATTPKREKMAYMFHGVHHEYPRDEERLAMPIVVSVTLAVIFTYLYTFLMGDAGFPFQAGFMSGYATYLLVHYIIHTMKPPRNALRILWDHHNLHHYKYPEHAFGVSSPLWDVVFGTMPPKK